MPTNKILSDIYFQDYVRENHGVSIELICEMSSNIQCFFIAMFLQHNKIPMPDITPTNFGLTVYKQILISKIEEYYKKL